MRRKFVFLGRNEVLSRVAPSTTRNAQRSRRGLQGGARGHDLQDREPLLHRERRPPPLDERERGIGFACAGFMCAADPGNLDRTRDFRGLFESSRPDITYRMSLHHPGDGPGRPALKLLFSQGVRTVA